jgi:hypothetical protein
MLYDADAKARLVFVKWYLHNDHDEEIDSKISLFSTVDLCFDLQDTPNLTFLILILEVLFLGLTVGVWSAINATRIIKPIVLMFP